MTTPITVENLESAGFSDTLSGILSRQALDLNPSRDFKKGNLVVRMWGSNRIAWTWSGEKLGPISTMEQVQALDSVINPVPSDAITAEKLTALEWFRDGVMFWKLNFGIKLSDRPGCASTLSTIAGCKTIHLGYVSTMSEVEALTAIAKRGITKD